MEFENAYRTAMDMNCHKVLVLCVVLVNLDIFRRVRKTGK